MLGCLVLFNGYVMLLFSLFNVSILFYCWKVLICYCMMCLLVFTSKMWQYHLQPLRDGRQ